MASDLTNAKSELWMAETNSDPRALLPCPSCDRMMAATDTHLRWAIGTGRVAWNGVEVAHASHLRPRSEGGTSVALECGACNVARGDSARFHPRPGAMVVRATTRKAGREARGIIRADEEALRA